MAGTGSGTLDELLGTLDGAGSGRVEGGCELRTEAPCTGFGPPSTTLPITNASSTTAAIDMATAATRLRQYTPGGSGPLGSIMKAR